MKIDLHQVSKAYADCKALSNISLEIKEGELLALLGPSGSGKTTLLKVIAGLEIPNQGQIFIDNKNVTKLTTNERSIGFVFQHYALFKHMSVFENIAFGLKVKPRSVRLEKEEIKNKVEELLKLVQIEHLSNRYTHELSGGQMQRVALARALAVEPRILLLDEPFSALDAKLKVELRRWLRKLQKKMNITIVLVTHDQEEALDVADRIVILNQGNIEQFGTPSTVYNEPINEFVYNFLGHYNVFKAIKNNKGKIALLSKDSKNFTKAHKWYNKHKIVSNLVELFKSNEEEFSSNEMEYFDVFVRPHDIEISKQPFKESYIEAKITHLNLAGPIVKVELESNEYELIQAELSQDIYNNLQLKNGDNVYTRAKQVTMFGD
ncbi:MAG: TOBE-like domain-containing protein [Pseudomonadota bacterium]